MIVINKSDQTLEISKCLKKLKFAIGARGIRGGTEGGSQTWGTSTQLSTIGNQDDAISLIFLT